MPRYDYLMKPLTVAGLTLKNRLLSAPTSMAELGPEEHYTDERYIGAIVKIINKAFKGNNIIIFQNENKLMFASRYISRFPGRDYHFTYWISDISRIKDFSSYSICVCSVYVHCCSVVNI